MLSAIDQGSRGINAGIDRLSGAADHIAREGANGDLAGNVVDLLKAKQEVRAGASVVKVADETIGTLIDVLA